MGGVSMLVAVPYGRARPSITRGRADHDINAILATPVCEH